MKAGHRDRETARQQQKRRNVCLPSHALPALPTCSISLFLFISACGSPFDPPASIAACASELDRRYLEDRFDMDTALAPWDQQCPKLKEALGKVREHWAAQSARPTFDSTEFAESFWYGGSANAFSLVEA